MPVTVVRGLEPVNVDVRDDESLARAPGAGELVLERDPAGAAPVRPGQVVGVRALELGAGVAAIHGGVVAIHRGVPAVARGTLTVGLSLLTVKRRPTAIVSGVRAVGGCASAHRGRLNDRRGVRRASRALGELPFLGAPVALGGGAIALFGNRLAIRCGIVTPGGRDVGGVACTVSGGARAVGLGGGLLVGNHRDVAHRVIAGLSDRGLPRGRRQVLTSFIDETGSTLERRGTGLEVAIDFIALARDGTGGVSRTASRERAREAMARSRGDALQLGESPRLAPTEVHAPPVQRKLLNSMGEQRAQLGY